ncbi:MULTISPECIES: glycosyltransferase family A protein [unclassified Methylobacterium]|nr:MULTISPECIES: glycosyltransferase family A protein [unclassified Methylobacterium]GBU18941.1 hypothetical protein AwMethylo_31560 [Methylobacterium sp.]
MSGHASAADAAGPVTLAVIVPVYQQPHFLSEAAASILAQAGAGSVGLVIVDDGCPLPETRELGLSMALADPRIRYLRSANRGLSGARNLGIAAALEAWPQAEALYMLDADNRLAPGALAAGRRVLAADPEIAFVYPQLVKFGIPWSGHVAVEATPLHVLAQGNFIEASSLIRRGVFEAGLRYDETMRDGYEDWEFWIRVQAAGFRARCVPAMGLDYRYRPESMVRGSARIRPVLLDALRRRHRKAYGGPSLLALEQAHHPRYAWVGPEAVACFTDPGNIRRFVPRADFAAGLWRILAEPEQPGLPPFLLFAEEELLESLRSARIAQGALRRLEAACADGDGAGLVLRSGDSLEAFAPGDGKPAALLVRTRAFAAAVAGEGAFPASPFPLFGLTVPFGLPAPASLDRALADCRAGTADWERPTRWHWQSLTLPTAEETLTFLQTELRGAPLSNTARQPDGRSVAIVSTAPLPGIAGRVASRLAAAGVAPHLLLYGPVDLRAGGLDAAASLDRLDLPPEQPSDFRYFGASFELPEADDTAWDPIRGALAGYDILVVAHPRLYPLMSGLRERGTAIAVLRCPEEGARSGDRRILAFEHAIDRLCVDDRSEAERLSAAGFPDSKIVVLSDAEGDFRDILAGLWA